MNAQNFEIALELIAIISALAVVILFGQLL